MDDDEKWNPFFVDDHPKGQNVMNRWLTQPVLKVENLTMRFGGLVAVNNLSFSAGRGDITALIGPNGAGKTTVFNCITGFYKPTVGRMALRQGNMPFEGNVETLTNSSAQSLKGPDGALFLLERMPDFCHSRRGKRVACDKTQGENHQCTVSEKVGQAHDQKGGGLLPGGERHIEAA